MLTSLLAHAAAGDETIEKNWKENIAAEVKAAFAKGRETIEKNWKL